MRLSYFATVLAFALSSLLVAATISPVLAAERPNILFICTDDQAAWALGASGYKQAITPNMDRLVHQGVYLTAAFSVTPVCSPSRASTMASRYGSELGITDWINPGPEPDLGLDPKVVIWPEVLASAGYSTGLVGKWHLGVPPQFHPTRNGYQYFMGFLAGGTKTKDPVLEKDGKNQKFSGLTADILADHAIEFLKRNQQHPPFLLSMHFRAPHTSYLPVSEEDWAPYKDLDPEISNPDYPKLDIPKVKRFTREYLAAVRSVDRNLGRLMQTLDDLNLSDNTVVIFTSDHGYNVGHNGIWHKGNGHWMLVEPPPGTANVPRGQRPNMYDRSIRVPCTVRWPGVIEPGSVVTETVTNLDWYPTLVAIAGAELPKGELIRGRNILPLLKGEKIAGWDNNLYAEYSTHHQSRTHMRMVRTPEWKLIRDFLNPERDELYNLKDDPGETTNLIHEPGLETIIADLHAKILENMHAINDLVLKEIEK